MHFRASFSWQKLKLCRFSVLLSFSFVKAMAKNKNIYIYITVILIVFHRCLLHMEKSKFKNPIDEYKISLHLSIELVHKNTMTKDKQQLLFIFKKMRGKSAIFQNKYLFVCLSFTKFERGPVVQVLPLSLSLYLCSLCDVI